MAMTRILAAIVVLLAGLGAPGAQAGFRSPESLVRNVYAYYGDRTSELSNGLPRDEETARRFFEPGLRAAWISPGKQPYDFFVQSPAWKIGAVAISILRRQYDKTYVAVAFTNQGRAVTLNFILVDGPEGWVMTDVESPHDSLRMFLAQYKR
jgi:hypothetical protein